MIVRKCFPRTNTGLVAKLKKIKASIADGHHACDGSDHGEEDDFMVVEKSIPFKMGKWNILSPEVRNTSRGLGDD